MPKPYQGVYENMEFAPYVYERYPLLMRKEVKDELSGKVRMETREVESDEREQEAAADGFVAPHVGPPALITESEHAALLDENEALKAELAALKTAQNAPAPPPKPAAKPAPAAN